MDLSSQYERYQRQIILPEFGEAAQQKLLAAKVLVAGAGGLGCPVLQYLTAAGIGTIGIADDDCVALNNLHRQVLYSVQDIGMQKALCASRSLGLLNPDIRIIPYTERLTPQNTLKILEDYDWVIDGTDNFATRYMINDACVLMEKPLVFGAISQFEGQVAVFNYRTKVQEQPANYRDLFPIPPKEDEVLNCTEAGVLGVLPGMIGTMMANETIKLITSIGEPLVNCLLTFNALNNQVFILNIPASPETRALIPATKNEFQNTDYVWQCHSEASSLEIDIAQFRQFLQKEKLTIIDVREPNEKPALSHFSTIRIPLGQLSQHIPDTDASIIVTLCQSGKRSLQAARILSGVMGNSKKIYSLRGGILAWMDDQNKFLE